MLSFGVGGVITTVTDAKGVTITVDPGDEGRMTSDNDDGIGSDRTTLVGLGRSGSYISKLYTQQSQQLLTFCSA